MREDLSTFTAEAFHPALGDNSLAGTLIVDRLQLRFVSQKESVEFPLVQLQIRKDQTTPGRYCFSSPTDPDWLICTFDAHILQHKTLLEQPATRNQIRELEATREFKRRLGITLGVLGGFAVVALLVSLLTGIMVRALVARIPPQYEQQVGDDLMVEIKQTETLVQDPKLLMKLDRAVAPLIKSLPPSPIQYKFYLLEDPLPNAFALPGGHVLVTTRLIEMAEKPEEIAGVIAHELAHVLKKHGFRKIISSTGPFLIFRVFLGNSSGVLPILGASSELLVRQSFSQGYELEADDTGWSYLVAAHIDPRGLANMLRKFEAEQEKLRGRFPQLNAFSSHPATAKRVRRLEERWQELKDKTGFIPL